MDLQPVEDDEVWARLVVKPQGELRQSGRDDVRARTRLLVHRKALSQGTYIDRNLRSDWSAKDRQSGSCGHAASGTSAISTGTFVHQGSPSVPGGSSISTSGVRAAI